MSCDCDVFGDELKVDHLASETVPEVFSRLVLREPHRDAPAPHDLYECLTCQRWYRVDRWVCEEVQFREDTTTIKRIPH